MITSHIVSLYTLLIVLTYIYLCTYYLLFIPLTHHFSCFRNWFRFFPFFLTQSSESPRLQNVVKYMETQRKHATCKADTTEIILSDVLFTMKNKQVRKLLPFAEFTKGSKGTKRVKTDFWIYLFTFFSHFLFDALHTSMCAIWIV